jgi:hypothetical protein
MKDFLSLSLSLCDNEGSSEEKTGWIQWRASGFNGGLLDPVKDSGSGTDEAGTVTPSLSIFLYFFLPHCSLSPSADLVLCTDGSVGERKTRNQHGRG